MEKDKNAGNKIPDITGDVVVEKQEVTDNDLDNVVGGFATSPKSATAKTAKAGCGCAGSVPTATYSQIEQ
jgi:hypothetical protein